jgi:hypothetical protein
MDKTTDLLQVTDKLRVLCRMGNRGHDLIVVGLTTTSGELYLIQHYVIKFVSDLRQVSLCSFKPFRGNDQRMC